ncbi:hypothetical protein MRB53_004863 [Persea americana]|uniref:Uncharacterized protein n=1 Tax=Persea americana TaxID=3435 RepID=A0ACC2MCC9_PERAE|nr:hypothetical protein MRB53_004863 [Persea americana]|eukprot:TRINITY_DN42097_c0_g1_i1.p1 TRINITY_DN42097_c0_g1~~TRINITY_DN42097_c0_g1_i1.p1  ORF type:complete len:179 (+),score=23.75 TRINITY_DN42097_c0_g1_i1:145-681(+)
MDTHGKQRKGSFSLNNFSFRKRTPESDVDPKARKPISQNGGLRKPKARREVGQAMQREMSRGAIVEGRKSVSHIETNVKSVAMFLQVKVIAADMPESMQAHAFRCARGTYDSLEKFSSKHMAYNMKKEFDKAYGPAWHCIVGMSFGSFVTHSTGCFLYFSMEELFVLVFKTRVERALR